jgi:3',5'-nucleoside bisphosphate phosphatase
MNPVKNPVQFNCRPLVSNGVNFADLHLHTVFSDGTLSCAELVSRAGAAGLSAIAIADHDTVAGYAQALEAGRKHNVEVLSGVELTAEYEGLEIHLLGYLFDCNYQPLLEELELLRKNRVERIYKISDKLKKNMDVTLDPDSVFSLSGDGTVGRLHVARAMVKDGLVNSVQEAFYKYIGDKCPGYVSGFKLTPGEAIKLIKDSGGVPVLAHPYTLRRDELIPEFVKIGLMGLEIYYSEHTQGMINFYLGLAQKYNLLATGGSDFHGYAKPDVRLGVVKIPYELVEKLKGAQKLLNK